jgi:DNA-binding Xre family transcriptional regulator
MGFNLFIIDKVLSGKLDVHRRIDTVTINRLCAVLECQPGDIMEYLPDEKEEGKA